MIRLRTTLLFLSTVFMACSGGSPPAEDVQVSDLPSGEDVTDTSQAPKDSEEPDASSPGDLNDAQAVEDTNDEGDISPDEGPPTWFQPEDCENTGEQGQDPLTLVHEIDVTEHPLGHYLSQMVDMERDPDHDRIYAVGWGGFYVFNEFDWGIQLAGRHDGQGEGLGQFYRLEVLEDSVVAVTNRDYGLAFIPAEDPANLYMSWVFNIGSGSGMAQIEDYLHVVTHTGALHTFDVSNPSIPQKIGKITGLGNAWDMVVKGNKGYVADNTMGVVVIDFSDPGWPTVAESFEAVAGVQDLSIQYDTLYVAVGSQGIQMFDITDPSTPTSKGIISYPKPVISVSTAGKFLWGTSYDDIFVTDILGGFEPYPLAHRRTDQFAMHVDAIGTKAYVANWGKLQVYNIDASIYGPDLLLDRDILFYWNSPEELEITMTNMGTGLLEIFGAAIDDTRFELVLEQSLIPPGESRVLKVLFQDDGNPVDASLCISSNDADQPMIDVPLRTALKEVPLALGEAAPDFTLTDSEGSTHSLSDELGTPVLLSFFSPSDPRAPSHFSDLQASIRAKYPNEELIVWGIATGSDLSKLNKFKEDMGITFPVLDDANGSVSALYQQPDTFPGASFPKEWIVSGDGTVIYTSNSYNPAKIKETLKNQ